VTLDSKSDNRVLLVEDSPVYQRLITGHLREWGFEVVSLADGLQAWTLLQQAHSPKLALMDWVMPKMDGTEVCRRLRQRGACESYVYTVLLTAKDGREDLLSAMDAGADDFLVKPFDELELKARLMVGRRILDLQAELISAREGMRYSATHDSLTGLKNRGELMDTLRRDLARAKRERTPVAIALIDVDRFKAVNDELGHPFGDDVLKEVARRLRSSLRPYDSVGRYGGEEFLIVLPGCDLSAGLVRADEIRMTIGAVPMRTARKERAVTVSMGIAVSNSGDLDVERLLNQADVALYEAKRNGRNRVEPAGDNISLNRKLAANQRIQVE